MRLVLGAALLALCVPALGQGVPRAECFPFERLSPDMRAEAEALLLKALDSEALYTIVGGLKPLSSSFASASVSVTGMNTEDRDAALARADRLRTILAHFRCGDEISAALLPFAETFEGKRSLDAFVFHRGSVEAIVRERAGFFAFWGVTPATPPAEVVMAFETDPTVQRFRAYGWMFGYPDHAVDFFVEAELRKRETGEFVRREFYQIPTVASETGRFVYAVPVGHVANDDDLALTARAEAILAAYRELREQYIGEGKPGVLELVRDWFDDGQGNCSPANALRKVEARAKAAA